MLTQNICHEGLLHLQKIVLQPFSANREPRTVIANLNIQKWHVYHQGCQGRKLQQKKHFIFTPDAGASNKLIFDVKLREARSEREIGLFITNGIQQFEEK